MCYQRRPLFVIPAGALSGKVGLRVLVITSLSASPTNRMLGLVCAREIDNYPALTWQPHGAIMWDVCVRGLELSVTSRNFPRARIHPRGNP